MTAVYGRWNGTLPAALDPHHPDEPADEVGTRRRR